MKTLIFAAALVMNFSSANAIERGLRDSHVHKQTTLDRVVAGWVCDLDGQVGGIKIGVGPSAQVMAGYGDVSCTEYGVDGAKIGEYNEQVKMAFLGGGVGLGLSVVESLRVRSLGVRLGNIDPRKFIGTRFGIEAGIDLDVIRNAVRASVGVSLSDTNGLGFELSLSHAKVIGFYAGLNIRGFVMHQRDHEGIIVGGVKGLGRVFEDIFNSKRRGDAVFKAENVVATKAQARAMADKNYRPNRKFTINVTPGHTVYQPKSNKLPDMIEAAIGGAERACQGGLITFYSALQCKNDKCSQVSIRAVCR